MLTSVVEPAIDPFIASLREREFARLDRAKLAYLDYTGSALYGESQLGRHHALLSLGVFGNPHSENEPSRTSSRILADARLEVLRFFDADPDCYDVCFTTNTTAAIKLVAESYPFDASGTFVLSADNHNSVNGIREYARRSGARVVYLPLDAELRLADAKRGLSLAARSARPQLMAFPAQSNFSGVKHPLELVGFAKSLGFDVLLDAAAFAPSNSLSLRDCPADFVTVSFYKLFGYPTGLGALIARRDALSRLKRPWFAGGTVDFVSVQNDLYQLHASAERFDDGTPDFLSIAALSAGFSLLGDVGMQRITSHIGALTCSLLAGLTELAHADGSPLVAVHGPRDMRDRGGTIAFNVLTSDGRVIPYWIVERRARDAGVAIRGGCFCNPGAAERAFGFDPDRTQSCMLATRDDFSIERLAECLGDGIPVGALRASVGLANNATDIRSLLEIVRSFVNES